MATTFKLQSAEFAVKTGRNLAVNNLPTIKFKGDKNRITMTLEVSFVPDQFNDTAGDQTISAQTGNSAVFSSKGIDVIDPNIAYSLRFLSNSDVISLVVVDMGTLGVKGDHLR